MKSTPLVLTALAAGTVLSGCVMIDAKGPDRAVVSIDIHDRSAATADAVREADLAFARRAQEAGMAQAFREYMDAEDGLVFSGPKPLKGAEAVYRAFGGDAPPKVSLEWATTSAWGSRGGDMGVTTGDWKRTPVDKTKPIMTGRYVTVWRKDAQGRWKGLIDIGEVDDKPQANAVNRP